jgi:hypothetical protein
MLKREGFFRQSDVSHVCDVAPSPARARGLYVAEPEVPPGR